MNASLRNHGLDNVNFSEKSKTSFSFISSTFGFVHHTGTDRSLELKVVKLILRRENLIILLASQCENIVSTDVKTGKPYRRPPRQGDLLDSLFRLRNTTVELLEVLHNFYIIAEIILLNIM